MPNVVTVIANPSEFMGYPVDLLKGLAGMGPALIDNAQLYDAIVKYNETVSPAGGGGGTVLGPALLTKDCRTVVTSSTAIRVPDEVGKPDPVVAKETPAGEDPWASYDLQGLLDKVKQHNVTVDGRVKTPGKLIAALDAAGVTP